jgi:hypothetical protein
VAPEQELNHADVGSAHAAPDDPGPERGPAARAEGSPCARSDQAVGGEAVPPLEGADRTNRHWPLDAVDWPSVEAVLAERDLDSGDLWVHCARRVGEREGCKCGPECENQAAHSLALALGYRFPSFES